MGMSLIRIIPVLLSLFLVQSPAAIPRIAILGDSIPYAGYWPALLESGLRQNSAYRNAEIVNFSLPSETASGLSEPGHAGGAFPRPCIHDRLGVILSRYKPTLVIACYGMNDGMMQSFSEANFQAYQQGMRRLKEKAESAGARFIVVTPPLYMADTPEKDSARYNAVLDIYAGWLNGQKKKGWLVADMRPGLSRQIRAAKEKDPRFIYAPDGVHPGPEGHVMIAGSVWPAIASFLNLPPEVRFPEGDAFRKILKRHNLFKLAWLSETGHKRPGIPAGIPIAELPRIPEDVCTKAVPKSGAGRQPRSLKDKVPVADLILDAVRKTGAPMLRENKEPACTGPEKDT